MRKYLSLGLIFILALIITPVFQSKSKFSESNLNSKVIKEQPSILSITGPQKPKIVVLAYNKNNITKKIYLNFLRVEHLQFIYGVPPLLAGNFKVLVNGKTISSFKISYVQSNVHNYQECIGKVNESVCLREYFVGLVVSKESIITTMGQIKDLYTKYPKQNLICHFYAHSVGIAAAMVSDSLSQAYKLGDNTCQFGYYHGVLLGATMQMDEVHFKQSIPTLCDIYTGSLHFYDCIHGVGHNLFARYSPNFTAASSLCLLLDKYNNDASSECESGVTMSFIDFYNMQNQAAKARLIPKEDIAKLCNYLDKSLLVGCWRFIISAYTSHPLSLLKDEYIKLCNSQFKEAKDACWAGVGWQFMDHFPKSNLSNIKEFCAEGKSELAIMGCLQFTLGLYYINSGQGGPEKICSTLPDSYLTKKEKCKFWLESERNMINSKGTDPISKEKINF